MDIEKEKLLETELWHILGGVSDGNNIDTAVQMIMDLFASHDQALVERVKGTQKKYEYQDKLTKEERYRGGEQCRSCSRRRDVLDVATVLELIKNNKTDI